MKKLLLFLVTALISNLSISQNYEDLLKSDNPFNNKGENYYNFLNTLTSKMKNKEINQDNLSDFIAENEFNFVMELNEDELNIYKNYFGNKDFNLKNLILLENFVVAEKLSFDKSKLLESIAYIKWFTLFSNDVSAKAASGISGFETCLDNCMKKKLGAVFNTGNWVDQTAFILGTPESTAWMVGSCTWDCL
ncbi:hypothetical protein NHF50_00670 [Flavobacterium sp. NRK F10]|uniref:hypothetical protein n=1 Tax=Flavobacterium sp. NRK F10 TaxID=2954931 RepID=UPI0020900F88|nr:hypothetical protein [Flavobacterium sp. NRK F10]MCO6173548.1 hypothetical protein [Flavobacterium sp. NRK F10]